MTLSKEVKLKQLVSFPALCEPSNVKMQDVRGQTPTVQNCCISAAAVSPDSLRLQTASPGGTSMKNLLVAYMESVSKLLLTE